LTANVFFESNVCRTAWDRIANPKAGAGGIRPKPDDFRLAARFRPPPLLVKF
jgi:hypothetical protein